MANPVAKPKISQPWGRPNPRYAAKRHTGIDYAMPIGTPVLAVASGKIKDVINDKSYGKVVILTADKYDIWYCHLSQQDVKKGQSVSVGEQLGLSGNTGNSTGPHLHLETRIAPFRYGNDVSCPFIEDPKTIDPAAPANRKVGFIAKAVAAVTPAPSPATKVLNVSEFLAGQADDISLVQSALIDIAGADKVKVTGKWDAASKVAYKTWQQILGYKGADADGNPGPTSLKKLGQKYGYKVV
jgi:hypothetical protein